jgi:hypothetical protein
MKKTLALVGLFALSAISYAESNSNGLFSLDKGKIDYVKGIVEAWGMGCAPPNLPEPVAEALALEAARTVAQKNLLETIKGVKLVGETTVENMILKSSLINKVVKGNLENASRCPGTEPKFINKNGQICAIYCMATQIMYSPRAGYKFVGPIVETLKRESPNISTTNTKLTKELNQIAQNINANYDAVVVDTRDIYFEPSEFVYLAVKDPATGEVQYIYTPATVQPIYLKRKGAEVAYIMNEQQLRNLMQRWGFKHPLIINAVDWDSITGTIFISKQDAAKILAADKKTHFLEKGNVIIWIGPESSSQTVKLGY